MAKSMNNINNQLILMELPYEIKQESYRPYINGKQRKERKRVNGKIKEFSIYIVIDKCKEN